MVGWMTRLEMPLVSCSWRRGRGRRRNTRRRLERGTFIHHFIQHLLITVN